MPTFYEATAHRSPQFPVLVGPADAEIVIIGGGFAGLACALSLMERGVRDCLLLESQSIGYGASGRNGGFVSAGFSLDAAELLKRLGRDEARHLYRMSEDAVARIRRRIAQHRISCDAVDSGILIADWFGDERPLRQTQRFMHENFGVEMRWLSRDETRKRLLTERYHCSLHEADAFHFNPLKYLLGEAEVLRTGGIRLHEQTRATAVAPEGSGWRVEGDGACVRCRHVVVCCGGHIDDLYRPLTRAVMPIATYVMTTEPLGERLRTALGSDAAVFDTRFAFDYYRPLPDTRLLWGGRLSIRERSPQDVARLLRSDLLRVYPQLEGVQVSHAWSGWMGYSRHKMPQLGRLPNGLWYALGFGGHGVAPTTLAGEALAQALTGEAEIPRGFSAYGLAPTFGRLGQFAAQATYWWMEGRDALRDWWLGCGARNSH